MERCGLLPEVQRGDSSADRPGAERRSIDPAREIRSRARHRKIPYTILQGNEEKTVKARSVLKALSKVKLMPGAIVTVFIPLIVQGKRVKAAYDR